jgi:hypothetical protein
MDEEKFIKLYNHVSKLDDVMGITTNQIRDVMDITNLDYYDNEGMILTILQKANEEKNNVEQ